MTDYDNWKLEGPPVDEPPELVAPEVSYDGRVWRVYFDGVTFDCLTMDEADSIAEELYVD